MSTVLYGIPQDPSWEVKSIYRPTDTNPVVFENMTLDELEDRLSDLRDVLPALKDLQQLEIVHAQIFKYEKALSDYTACKQE